MDRKNYYNALTFDNNIMKCVGSEDCSRINYVGGNSVEGCNLFTDVRNSIAIKNIYISDIMDEEQADKAIDLMPRKLMLNLSMTLYDVGICDKKYGRTPIGLAHSYGLLNNGYVCGCNYVDKDDIDLMVQSNATAVLLPSYSMGNGFGVPPLRMMLSRGLLVRLGSADNVYNIKADMAFEAELLRLAVCADLKTQDAVTKADMQKILCWGNE